MTDRRDMILRVAEELLRHYGVRKTTMGDIARAAEIGVGTIYIEFSSKDAILEELASSRHQHVLNCMQQAVESKETFPARFRALMNARIRSFMDLARKGAHAAELVHCGGCEPVERAFDDFRGRQHAFLRDFLATASETGEAQVDNPDLSARVILQAYSSFSPPDIFDIDVDERAELLNGTHDLILEGLVSRDR
jgi:AcrR family transcriptional regulator